MMSIMFSLSADVETADRKCSAGAGHKLARGLPKPCSILPLRREPRCGRPRVIASVWLWVDVTEVFDFSSLCIHHLGDFPAAGAKKLVIEIVKRSRHTEQFRLEGSSRAQ